MKYVPGVGIDSVIFYADSSRLIALTGSGRTGCDAKIKKIYKVGWLHDSPRLPFLTIQQKCCSMYRSGNEIFMLGFSRGAFVVGVVAGMLYHLGALRTNEVEFDTIYSEALEVWQDLRKDGCSNLSLTSNQGPY